MRSVRLLLALALAGCAGGQTGEITMLGACREDVGPGDLSEVSSALDSLGREQTVAITWMDARFGAGDTDLVFTLTEREPARLVGGEGCDVPFVSSPVEASVRSGDGAVDAVLDGAIGRTAADSVSARADAPYDGELGPGALVLEVSVGEELTTGSLSFDPESETEDGTTLALF